MLAVRTRVNGECEMFTVKRVRASAVSSLSLSPSPPPLSLHRAFLLFAFFICHFPFSLLCALAWRRGAILIFATSHFTCSFAWYLFVALPSHHIRPPNQKGTPCAYAYANMCTCARALNFIHLTFSQKFHSDIYHLMCVRQVVNPSKSRQDTPPTQRIKKKKKTTTKNGWCVDSSKCFHSLAYILNGFYVFDMSYTF